MAVTLNCGMGSSSLNADVKALERLQIVRDWNSSYFGSKLEAMHRAGKMLGNFKLALDKGLVDHNLGSDIREFASLQGFYLLSHGLKVPLHSVDPDRDAIANLVSFICLPRMRITSRIPRTII